jgi:O-antigen ligase
VLLIAVSFGFIGLFMYIISILICLIKYCFIWNQASEINYIGLYLLVYLVSGGIFQDWLSNQTSWIFYSISIIFLTYSKRLPCTSIGNDL